MASLSGFTVFCDDIRIEIDQKFSFIGVYHGVIRVVDAFPIVLPKFGFGIVITEDIEDARRRVHELQLAVLMPGKDEPLYGQPFPAEHIREAAARSEEGIIDGESPIMIRLEVPLVVAPLVLERPGLIKVRVTDGIEIGRLGSLRIEPVAVPQTA